MTWNRPPQDSPTPAQHLLFTTIMLAGPTIIIIVNKLGG